MLFPQASEIYAEYLKAIHSKHIVYELMIAGLLLSMYFKRSRFSFALQGMFITLVVCSLLDKITGVFTYKYSDIIVILGSFYIGFLSWNKYQTLKR
jgi:hypothetical protein